MDQNFIYTQEDILFELLIGHWTEMYLDPIVVIQLLTQSVLILITSSQIIMNVKFYFVFHQFIVKEAKKEYDLIY